MNTENKLKIDDFTRALAECIHQAQCSVVDHMAHAEIWKKELLELAKSEEPVSEQNLSNVQRFGKNWKDPVSEDMWEVSKQYALRQVLASTDTKMSEQAYLDLRLFSGLELAIAHKDGAKWQEEHLWKPADGDDLPIIDREVIALLDNGMVVFAHRPPEYWDGKNIITGKVTRNYPKTYDKGGWNIPNVKLWLDVYLPKEIEL